MCRTGTDFESNPPFLYYCSSGVWKLFSPLPSFKAGTPGPNCAAGVSSSVIKNLNLQYFYFDGDAPNVQDTIKNNFYQLLMIQPIGLFSCKFFPNLCVKNDMSVSLGVKGKCQSLIIPFADTASRYIDGVSVPSLDKHKCSLVEKFNSMPQSINGVGGNTYDPFGTRSQKVDPNKCNSICDPTASCVCHLTYAFYQCLCAKGYGGSGTVGQCNACPHNTYNDGSTIYCQPCPANSGHSLTGSLSVSDCKCFKGYEGRPESGNPCTVRSCVPLLPPSNGAFIGVCNSKYNSVCRIQCNEGYEVSGSAERKCIVADGPNIMV
ncbi:unnamed protein product, partial [Porites evermanni]